MRVQPVTTEASNDAKSGDVPINTCPMHPEDRHMGPVACPLFGMGLEPEQVSLEDEGPNPELIDLTNRFWVGIALSVPLLLLSMGPLVGSDYGRSVFGERASLWLEFALVTRVILWSGWSFLERGYQSFRTMNLNMFSLIGMGVGVAYLFSVLAVLASEHFPAGFGNSSKVAGYFVPAVIGVEIASFAA